MKLKSSIWCLLLLCCSQPVIASKQAVSIAYGMGTKHSKVYRLNLQHEWCSPSITPNNHVFNGYWELAAAHLHTSQQFAIPTNHSLNIVSASGVVRFKSKLLLPLYLDLGIGLAYMSNQNYAMRQLGSNILFEDRIGFGILFGKQQQFEFGYRALHYSNAYFAQVNGGLNMQMLVLGYWF